MAVVDTYIVLGKIVSESGVAGWRLLAKEALGMYFICIMGSCPNSSCGN